MYSGTSFVESVEETHCILDHSFENNDNVFQQSKSEISVVEEPQTEKKILDKMFESDSEKSCTVDGNVSFPTDEKFKKQTESESYYRQQNTDMSLTIVGASRSNLDLSGLSSESYEKNVPKYPEHKFSQTINDLLNSVDTEDMNDFTDTCHQKTNDALYIPSLNCDETNYSLNDNGSQNFMEITMANSNVMVIEQNLSSSSNQAELSSDQSVIQEKEGDENSTICETQSFSEKQKESISSSSGSPDDQLESNIDLDYINSKNHKLMQQSMSDYVTNQSLKLALPDSSYSHDINCADEETRKQCEEQTENVLLMKWPAQYHNDIKTLKQQNDLLSECSNQKDTVINELKKEKADLLNIISELTSQSLELNLENENFRHYSVNLDADKKILIELRQENVKLKQDLKVLKNIESEFFDFKIKNEELITTIDNNRLAKECEINALKSKIEQLEHELLTTNQTVSDLQSRSQEVCILVDKLQGKDREIESLKKDKCMMEESVLDLNNKVDELMVENEKLNNISRLKEEKLKDMDNLTMLLEKQSNEIRDQNGKLLKLAFDLNEKEQHIKDLFTDKLSLEQTVSSLNDQLNELRKLEDENHKLKSDLVEEKDKREEISSNKSLEENVYSLGENISKLNNEILAKDSQISALMDSNAELKNDIETLHQKLDELKQYEKENKHLKCSMKESKDAEFSDDNFPITSGLPQSIRNIPIKVENQNYRHKRNQENDPDEDVIEVIDLDSENDLKPIEGRPVFGNLNARRKPRNPSADLARTKTPEPHKNDSGTGDSDTGPLGASGTGRIIFPEKKQNGIHSAVCNSFASNLRHSRTSTPKLTALSQSYKYADNLKYSQLPAEYHKASRNELQDVSSETTRKSSSLNRTRSMVSYLSRPHVQGSAKGGEVIDLTRDESRDRPKRRTPVTVKPYTSHESDDDIKIIEERRLPCVNSLERKPSQNCHVSPERILEINRTRSMVSYLSRPHVQGSAKGGEVIDLTRDESRDRPKRRTPVTVKPYTSHESDDDIKIIEERRLPCVNSLERKPSQNCHVSPERILEINRTRSMVSYLSRPHVQGSAKGGEVIDLTRDESRDRPKRRTPVTVKPYTSHESDDDIKIIEERRLPCVNSLERKPSQNCHVSPERILEIQCKYGEERELCRQVEEERLKKELYAKHNEARHMAALDEQIRRHLKITDVVLDDTEPEEAALPELTPKMQEKIAALRPNPSGEALVEGFGQKITRTDIQTLSGLNWLNDEVINFYMNLIIERGKSDKYMSVYAFDTYFHPKLVSQGYSTVKQWTKKVDIFNHKLLLVPIHLGTHWCMATIDFRDRTVRYYDSMGGKNNICLNALLKYLNDESMDKKKTPYDTSNWNLVNMKDIPRQMNGSDCGIFSCMFAEYTSRNAKITFSQKDMPYFRRKMVYEIITKKLLL